MSEKQESVAVPERVTAELVQLTQAIGAAQLRFNAYLMGVMGAMDLDDTWRISNDGRRFVKVEQPDGQSV